MPKLMRRLLLSTRIVAAAALPAVLLFAVASDDRGGANATWLLYLTPVAMLAIVAVGWLDGVAVVAVISVWCGLIFAGAAYAERDDRPLPLCEGIMDIRTCKNDASPEDGFYAAMWVLVGGGAVALINAGYKALAPRTDARG